MIGPDDFSSGIGGTWDAPAAPELREWDMRTIFAAFMIAGLAISLVGAQTAGAATLKQQSVDEDAPTTTTTNDNQTNNDDTPGSNLKADPANRLSGSEGAGTGPETNTRDNVLRMRTRR